MSQPANIPPFKQLREEDQKSTIDVSVLVIALNTRVPLLGVDFYERVRADFINSYKLGNIAKYAFRQVSEELMTSDWEFTITKRGMKLTTAYTKLQGNNGQANVIVPPS